MRNVCVLAVLAISSLAAASVDGRWTAKIENRRKGAQEIVFNLNAAGDRLSGAVAMGRKARPVQITDGKVNGDEISFTTVARGKKGDVKMLWKGHVSDNELKGTRQRDGARRGQPFTAVKQ